MALPVTRTCWHVLCTVRVLYVVWVHMICTCVQHFPLNSDDRHYYSTRNNAACTHCQKITCDLVLGVWGLQRSQTNYCDKIVKIIHASLHVGIQMTDFFRIAMNLNFIAWENSAFCHHPQIGQSSWFLASKPRCLKQKSYRRFDPSGTFSISSTIGTMDWHHNFKQKFYWANNKKILSGISKHYLQALEDISMHACINF